MALSGCLPQINLGVQGETKGGLHKLTLSVMMAFHQLIPIRLRSFSASFNHRVKGRSLCLVPSTFEKVTFLSSNTSTYANPEFCNFQTTSIHLLFEGGWYNWEIVNGVTEIVNLSKQKEIKDRDDGQLLLDSHSQELTIDELIEITEQDIEII
ncbi:hypothetical protein TNCV_2128621 [Trichonephila clavipes]|nr:hypothetical protein TNCV_2128621 [Trichonephila clavipes]